MTEKEKMLNNMLYNANYDEELINERLIAKDLCYQYNNLKPSLTNERDLLLRKIIGKTKNKFLIEQPFLCDYGYNIEIGENFYANHNLVILDGAKVSFGDDVFIAPNCSFYTAGHPLEYKLRNEGIEYAKPISVGNGDNVVIGAGSVVTKDIPSNSLAYGNPCKVARSLPVDGNKIDYI